MANISQEVNIDMLEKLADGSYKKKNPSTKASQVIAEDGSNLESHLADITNEEGRHGVRYWNEKAELNIDGEWKETNIKILNLDPATWEGVQNIVRAGLANEFFTVGDQVASNYDGGEVIWEVIGIDVDTPADSQFQHSMTIQTRDCLYNMAFDPSNDNRYINSPIRTHLNGEFLNKLDPELSAVLGSADKKVAKRNDLGGGQDSFSDKVFLLSRVEVGLGAEGDTTGEAVYPFYDGVSNAARIKNLNMSPRAWWLRSPIVGHSSGVRIVSTGGNLSDRTANYSYGVSPACVII